jgi:hypothetical protein
MNHSNAAPARPRYFIVSRGGDGYDWCRMINALLLILRPVPTWDRIAVAQRKWLTVLAIHLVPLLVLTGAAEGYGMVHWGKIIGTVPHVKLFPLSQTLIFQTAQLVLSLGIVFLSAHLIKALGETFHGRHSFTESFTVAAYGLSPLFLLRLFNALPWVSPWVPWVVGILLAASLLYHGLPRVMRPDPPHALGLYLMSVLLLVMITGLACFLKAWYLQGRFARLDAIISNVTGQ